MQALPEGVVTFLFSDIEGSTRLLDQLGSERYAQALAEHRRQMRSTFTVHGGVEVDTQGDAFFVAFADARSALRAAAQAQDALASGPVRVRMGIHTGEPLVTDEGYVGIDVHQAARVMSAGHGGQVLVSEATRTLLDGDDGLVDLGLHRLKDLTEPRRLWQLGEGEFPPLKTLYRTNLPVQPSPLVGREAELAEVLALLRKSRLVTLTGAGGSGKTRLALQAAAELVDECADGVWWISLAALRDPDLVEPTIAQVVGAKDGLPEHLRGKQALLLLDNFEQLLGAAPAVSQLLAEAPDLRIVVTSRERLALAAEQEYEVPTMAPVEAVALFAARARQLRPDFEPDAVVEKVCRRLDGLPLAVELAAARVKVLTPEQILQRLGRSLELLTTGARDAPERQRTLTATIDWSYELLDGAEKRLFARLAVFAGSFDLEAAEAICGADLDTLAALVDKSLLRRTDEGRFFMLETIADYARERLTADPNREGVSARHARHFAGLADAAAVGLRTAEETAWLDRVQLDLDNFRSALRWSLEGGDVDVGLRLCLRLKGFWFTREHLLEAGSWLELACSRLPDAPAERHAPVLEAAGEAALYANRLDEAEPLIEAALALARAFGDRETEAGAVRAQAMLARTRDDPRSAIGLEERALGIFRELGDAYAIGRGLHYLAEYHRDIGDYAEARRLFKERINQSQRSGRFLEAAYSIHSLGDLELDVGRRNRAAALYRESLELLERFETPGAASSCLAGLAAVAAGEGRFERAARLWGAVEAVETAAGVSMVAFERSRYEALVQEACKREPAALVAGRELDLGSAIEEALSVE